jgi:flavin reductase (DIM6/NTAB) family NADH-FMN oxidoreductase RutF
MLTEGCNVQGPDDADSAGGNTGGRRTGAAATARRAVLDAETLAPEQLRRAMGCFATGITVVTTQAADGKLEGVTANSFSTVSLDPPLVLWSLARSARSFAQFAGAPHFAVNVLGAGQVGLSRHFSVARADKLTGIEHHLGHGGCPVLTGVLAHFECVRESMIDGGDHLIFIGRVLRASFREGEPLIYSGGRYHRAVPFDGVTGA